MLRYLSLRAFLFFVNTNPAPKILIVGGGIAGLTCLACLTQKGIKATLIERAPKFDTIGYVIGLFPNGLSVLRELGMEQTIIKNSEIIENYVIKDMAGKDVWRHPLSGLGTNLPSLELERSVLQAALLEKNRGADIRTNTTISNLEQGSDSVRVTMSDGKQETYDIVIAADGINSSLRNQLDPASHQQYSGFSYWMVWMPMVPGVAHTITNYIGQRKLLGIFPSRSANGMMVFLGAGAPAHSFDRQAPLRLLFADYAVANPLLASIINQLPEDTTPLFHHDDNELRGKVWHQGNVVFIGDAVHAFSPLLGMGASMAMEDASVLAEEIVSAPNKAAAFAAYEKRRKPRIAKLARHSLLLHKLLVSPHVSATLQPMLFSRFGGPNYLRLVREFVTEKP